MSIPVSLASILATFAMVGPASALDVPVMIDVGRGPVSVHVPPGYDPAVPMALVMALHGYTGSGAVLENMLQLTPLADEYGFLYVTPDGLVDPDGRRFWNGTDACCDFFDSNTDDSAYLRALLEEIKLQLTVDRRRIYVIGYSNGGFMSYRMACEHAGEIAAIASLSGATFDNPAVCSPSEPVHVLEVHGTADLVIRYGGGATAGDSYPGAVETVETWASYNGCDIVRDTSPASMDLDTTQPGAESSVTRYTQACAAGGSSELWSMLGVSHFPSLTNEFRYALVEWLLAHPKPVPGTPLCFGDGSGLPCPCGNDSGALGESCTHSGGVGMTISGSGSTSIAADDLQLTARGVPVGNIGIFYAGQTSLSPGNALFDGLQCVGGSTQRFRGQLATTSEVDDMDFVAQDLFGLFWNPGTTYYFQYFTRDNQVGSSPCGGFATLSPAYAVTLSP